MNGAPSSREPRTAARARGALPADAFEVPDGEEPVARCPHCDRPFRTERHRDLHVGEVHAEEATEEELDRYEAAAEEEADDLFVFHLKVVAAVVAVIMGYVYLYGFVLS